MGEPVFVIHGVANRDRDAFSAAVDRLDDAAGNRWDLRPVFWGDLGADDRWVRLTVPTLDGAAGELRDDDGDDASLTALAVDLLASSTLVTAAELRGPGDDAAAVLLLGVRERLADGDEMRDTVPDEELAEEVSAAVLAEWGQLRWLPVAQDEVLLREVGAAVAGAAADARASGPSDELRGIDVAGFVRRRLRDMDAVVGAVVESAAGRFNSFARTAAAPGVARFFGDVLTYQRNRGAVQARVREALREAGADLGSRERPVRVLAHSLGGVITLDLATGTDPVWVSQVLTFGSQFGFLHAVDPRGGLLASMADGLPVTLPPSVGAWTNLWEPLDLLAFWAAPVFRLHDGSSPRDVRVPHLASAGLWTHSAYWHLEALVVAMESTFGSRVGAAASER